MKVKEAGLTSLHVLIMRTLPLCKTGKWKQCKSGQIAMELSRWEIESEIPTSLGKERALFNVLHKQSL